MSTLVLMGSGMSAALDNVYPCRPPTGPELFASLKPFSDVFSAIRPDIAAAFAADFEKGLAALNEQQPELATDIQIALARYLCHFASQGDGFYHQLARTALKPGRRVCFSTLNYDLLLEQAVAECGGHISLFGRENPRNEVQVLKLHGSLNWFVQLPIGFRDLTLGGPEIADGRVVAVSHDEARRRLTDPYIAVPPVMSQYVGGKRSMAAHRILRQVWGQFAVEAGQAERILIIGVHCNPNDTHVWDAITASSAEVFVINPQWDSYQEWIDTSGRSGVTHLAKWLDAISICSALSLSR